MAQCHVNLQRGIQQPNWESYLLYRQVHISADLDWQAKNEEDPGTGGMPHVVHSNLVDFNFSFCFIGVCVCMWYKRV